MVENKKSIYITYIYYSLLYGLSRIFSYYFFYNWREKKKKKGKEKIVRRGKVVKWDKLWIFMTYRWQLKIIVDIDQDTL